MVLSEEQMEPYSDADAHEVLNSIVNDPLFLSITQYLWPDEDLDSHLLKARNVHSIEEFQKQFMHRAIRTIVEKSSDGLSYSGIENLEHGKGHLFIANHRDILLDSALLQIILVENDFKTSEITFGSNLMKPGFITDLGKLNRMFIVQREGTNKELFKISTNLSTYIRRKIKKENTSIWIAQRAGRTKDGKDKTQTGLLKMMNISGDKSVIDNFKELNIIPLSISYEFEPCADFKAREIFLSSMHTKYKKSEDEDVQSILKGIVEPKGRIHMSFGEPIKFDDIPNNLSENSTIKEITENIDKIIYKNYKNWPSQYIAYDLLHGDKYSNQYSKEEKLRFENYLDEICAKQQFNDVAYRKIVLKNYANSIHEKFE